MGTTYAPIGHTPVIRQRVRHREKITVLGSLTISPTRSRFGLHCEFLRGRSIDQNDLIAHLRELRHTLGRPLVVILDNLGQHKGRLLRTWCESVGDVHLEFLPPYAPELNAIEAVWSHGKRVTTCGRFADDAAGLMTLAHQSIEAASSQSLLRGFVRSTRLPIAFDLPKRINQPEAV